MNPPDAFLLGAVVCVNIRPPVGREPGLNGCDQLRQRVGKIKSALRSRRAVNA